MADGTLSSGGNPHRMSPDEAFTALADPNRMAILRALWEAYDPPETESVSFSELFDQVDIRDSGNFTYHLEQLVGQFVRQTETGYKLRHAGRKVISTVLSGTAIEQPTVTNEEVGKSCIVCGSDLRFHYEDERVYLRCPDCDGLELPGTPSGSLTAFRFPPRGLDGRSPEAAFHACEVKNTHYGYTALKGICPECTSDLDISVDVCREHHSGSDSACPNCDRYVLSRVYLVCPTCKANWQSPLSLAMVPHPGVIAFYDNHGIDISLNDWEWFAEQLYREYDETLVDTDPIEVAVTVSIDNEKLRVVIDEQLTVDVQKPSEGRGQ